MEPITMTRNTVFISHATPHDSDFVRWLGTRLTGHGYKVWADLFELKGGNPFWSTIEEALRHHACKVIFVVSKASVEPGRTGTLNELSLADALKKQLKDDSFIIPVKIDATPFSEFPIQIHRLNAVDFSAGWGAKLVELLDTLEDAGVPKASGDQRAEFDRWRATMVRILTIIEAASEKVLTNLLPITRPPQSITFYEYDGDNTKIAVAMKETGIPHGMFNRHIISFAAMSEIQSRLSSSFTLAVRAHVGLDPFLEGSVADPSSPTKDAARKMTTFLFRQHVESHLRQRGLKEFKMSTGSAFYFPSGLVPNDKVPYLAASGRRTNKNVVGRSERNNVHWHLAMKVNIVLGPPPIVRLKPYICFSEDGTTALDDAKRTSAIRRRFCKNWWNAHWRQLVEAFCTFLADGKEKIVIGLGGPDALTLGARPLELLTTRRMPDDLIITDEPEDPTEPDDDDPGIEDDPDIEDDE
jgi:TIR domain-containing protein